MANEKRLIDANELCLGKFPHAGRSDYKNGWNDALDAATTQAPTVDAVEVVRCKDCKKWQPSGSMAGNSEDDLQPIGVCILANCCRKQNDFCSYGERKYNA